MKKEHKTWLGSGKKKKEKRKNCESCKNHKKSIKKNNIKKIVILIQKG